MCVILIKRWKILLVHCFTIEEMHIVAKGGQKVTPNPQKISPTFWKISQPPSRNFPSLLENSRSPRKIPPNCRNCYEHPVVRLVLMATACNYIRTTYSKTRKQKHWIQGGNRRAVRKQMPQRRERVWCSGCHTLTIAMTTIIFRVLSSHAYYVLLKFWENKYINCKIY